MDTFDWSGFEEWLKKDRSKKYSKHILSYAKKYYPLGFSNDLVSMQNRRNKGEVMKAIALICRYIDIMHDTDLHNTFISWLKRKEIKWAYGSKEPLYEIAKRVKLEDVISTIQGLREDVKITSAFALVSGLRAGENMKAIEMHDDLCQDGIMELFWQRKTKRANAIYCHPLIHNKVKSAKGLTLNAIRCYWKRHVKAFRFSMLRKINFTINVRVDPLLAEFMQGRSGNVSMKHYFLPLLESNRAKWLEVWNPIVRQILGE
ncbi:MAG: integrase [Nitrososphaerales archaeon]